MEAGLRVMELQEFIHRFKYLIEKKKAKFSLFLGAGCSVSSGIPTAGFLVDKMWLPILKEMETGNQENFDEWLKKRFPEYKKNDAAQFYGEIIETLFPTAKERQTEIEDLVKYCDPGFGYAILAKLMEKYSVQCNIILTTNFDDMIADALYLYTYRKPIVIFHEALAGFLKIGDTRPMVIKLHGDSKLSPLNTNDETDTLSDKITPVIKNLFSETGLIFIGYGGNDSSINKVLSEVSGDEGAFPWGIYWIGERIPDNKMGEFLRKRNALWVKHKNFDELMLSIKESLELELPTIYRFESLFTNLSSECDNLTKEIHAKPDSEKKELLEKAAKKASQELIISTEPISWPGILATSYKIPTGLTSAMEAISRSGVLATSYKIPTGLTSAMEAISRNGILATSYKIPTGLTSTMEVISRSGILATSYKIPPLATNYEISTGLTSAVEAISSNMKTSKNPKILQCKKEIKESSE